MQQPPGPTPPRAVPPLPAGLLLPGGDAAWGAVLRELPDPAAMFAWEALRSVRLWAAAEPPLRRRLFREGAHALREVGLIHQTFDLDLVAPLATLAAAMEEADADPEEVSWACMGVSEWATRRGARETAMLFAETAALVRTDNPGLAFVAGRLARSCCNAGRAEHWLKRAAAVAWRLREWEVYARSINSLGNLQWEQGAYAAARKLYERALRAARRNRLPELEGDVLHDLFIVHFTLRDFKRAEALYQAAAPFYLSGHPRLPQFAHDVAYFWIAQGYFARALPVLQLLLAFFDAPHDRLRVLASAARAAGACGKRDLFERLWIEANTLLPDLQDTSTLAAALVEIAIGASSLGDWEHAYAAAFQAHEAAQQRSEADVEFRAEAVLAAVHQRRKAEVEGRSTGRGTTAADELATEILSRLQATDGMPS